MLTPSAAEYVIVVDCGEIMLQPVVPSASAAPTATVAMRRVGLAVSAAPGVRCMKVTDPPRTDDGIPLSLGDARA
ncbi:hypothetical protein GCM10009777_33480 [Microbacterium pumilum]|uniref:Uncharacterized protein n=1 Tax=Microbacterium pumilum TaxID=344165 RepID=A0ABN2SZ34_9MICO